jgi:hypothetical protein
VKTFEVRFKYLWQFLSFMRGRYLSQVLRAANPPRHHSVPASGVTGSSSCFDRGGQRLSQTRQILVRGVVYYTTDGRIMVVDRIPSEYDRALSNFDYQKR